MHGCYKRGEPVSFCSWSWVWSSSSSSSVRNDALGASLLGVERCFTYSLLNNFELYSTQTQANCYILYLHYSGHMHHHRLKTTKYLNTWLADWLSKSTVWIVPVSGIGNDLFYVSETLALWHHGNGNACERWYNYDNKLKLTEMLSNMCWIYKISII